MTDRVPPLWRGQTAAIIAGGPSLTALAVEQARRAGLRLIAINNAYEIAPFADLLWWCDWRWYLEHQDRPGFKAFPGRRACLEQPGAVADWHLTNTGQTGLEATPTGVRAGSNSAYQCLNLAHHLRVARVVLLGVDMKPSPRGRTHWHRGHPWEIDAGVYARSMLPKFATIAAPLAQAGVEVINANPDSALEVFPRLPLDEVLHRWAADMSPSIPS